MLSLISADIFIQYTVSMDCRWVHNYYFLDPIHTSYGRTQDGEAADSRSDDRRIYDNILNFNKSFAGVTIWK